MTHKKKCAVLVLSLLIGWYPTPCAWQREEQVYEYLERKEKEKIILVSKSFFPVYLSEINTYALLPIQIPSCYLWGRREGILPWKWPPPHKSCKLGLGRKLGFFCFSSKEILFFWQFYGHCFLQISSLALALILHSLETISTSFHSHQQMSGVFWIRHVSNAVISKDSHWIDRLSMNLQKYLIWSVKLLNRWDLGWTKEPQHYKSCLE